MDLNTSEEQRKMQIPLEQGSRIVNIALDSDRFMLAIGTNKGKIILWDTVRDAHIKDLEVDATEIRGLAFSKDGNILATGGVPDEVVRLWDMNTKEQIQVLKPEGKIGGIKRLTFSPDGSLLAAACMNRTIQIWNVSTQQHIMTLTDNEIVTSISFSPDLRTLASSNLDGSVGIWSVVSGEEIHTMDGFIIDDSAFDVSPDGKTIACHGRNRDIYYFDASNGTLQNKLERPLFRRVFGIAYSPDGKTFVETDKRNLTLFDATTGADLVTFKGHVSGVFCVEYSPNGETIASGSADDNVRIWDVNTGETLHILKGHELGVLCIAFSPDGSIIASGSETVRFWDAKTGEKKHVITQSGIIKDIDFSPDGKTLAFAGNTVAIKLWDIPSGKLLDFPEIAPSRITCVDYSPDGKNLAVGTYEDGILIYDLNKKTAIQHFPVKDRSVKSVAFASNGNTLVSQFREMIYLWDVNVK